MTCRQILSANFVRKKYGDSSTNFFKHSHKSHLKLVRGNNDDNYNFVFKYEIDWQRLELPPMIP